MTKVRTIKNNRKGLSLVELTRLFPDEKSAIAWFETHRWGDEKSCPKCGSLAIIKNNAASRKEPYRCKDCRAFFSVMTGTIMYNSKVSLREWVIAIYLISTNLKGVSSYKLGRDLGRTQKTAWLLAQKIRDSFVASSNKLEGEVEADETFIGGKARNMKRSKRTKAHIPNKQAVLGMVERGGRIIAKPVRNTGAITLRNEVIRNVKLGSTLYTDELASYKKLGKVYNHQSVNHSAWEYVRGQAHTNGIESFWALLKRGYHGTHHHLSIKHLHRYINEFAGRHNNRSIETLEQMAIITQGFIGKRLTYKELVK